MRIPPPSLNEPSLPVPDYGDCLAKTRKTDHGMEKGCDLFAHLVATERVAEALASVFRGTPRGWIFEDITKMVYWLAALHDIGKMTPVFLNKIYRALGQCLFSSLPLDSNISHAFCSQVILSPLGTRFARLAGAHHGSAAKGPPLSTEGDALLGGTLWTERRKALILRLQQTLGLPDFRPESMEGLPSDLVLGAVILSDWLSSGMDIPHGECPEMEEIHRVVSRSGFSPVRIAAGKTFEELFTFSPNTCQKIAGEQAEQGNVYIIESEMGSGKTEASLYLAYQLLEQHQANGIYFALPTKLTSEKIVERIEEFLERVMPCEGRKNALLIHGQSWIDWMPDDNNDRHGRGDEGSVNSFFLSKKRALLAPFAAGTIDQALLSVLNVKHKALRAFALSGKVVVIDEVHSYDTYTGSLVKSLVDSLRKWGCTVIILSATLTREARANLLGEPKLLTDGSSAYPLVTVKRKDSVTEYPLPPAGTRTVSVRHATDEDYCLAMALEKACSGQQVLWIENTVAKSQEIYGKLAASCPSSVECGLIHSRFPLCERERKESYWSGLYGKHSAEDRRMRGRILVGTQVLEQSIDIDADFLVTRLAPCDMIFQRMGRLWRHPSLNVVRPPGAECCTLILHGAWLDGAYDYLRNEKTFLPYDLYTVKRTQDVWKPIDHVELPADIRPLLEEVYGDRPEEGTLLTLKMKLDAEKRAHERKALGSTAELSQVQDDDDGAQTRLNDEPIVDVLLLATDNKGDDFRHVIHSPFVDHPIIIPPRDAPWEDRKLAIKALSRCMIKVRESKAPRYDGFPVDFLSHLLWTGDGSFHPVRAAFLDPSGKLLNLSSQSAHPSKSKSILTYNGRIGYKCE